MYSYPLNHSVINRMTYVVALHVLNYIVNVASLVYVLMIVQAACIISKQSIAS